MFVLGWEKAWRAKRDSYSCVRRKNNRLHKISGPRQFGIVILFWCFNKLMFEAVLDIYFKKVFLSLVDFIKILIAII